MRLPTLEKDYWELRSAEAMAAQKPSTFSIPPLDHREALQVGQAAKLIFDIESEDETGRRIIQGERIWVIISEKIAHEYIGILDSQPASFAPSDAVYLCFGAEVPVPCRTHNRHCRTT